VITDARKPSKWKAAVLGGFYAVVAGPAICYLILAVFLPLTGSVREFVSSLVVLWVFTVLYFGVAAFVLGAGGALLLQAVAPRCRSMRNVILLAVVLGLVLGGVVPLMPLAVAWGPKHPVTRFVPFAAAAGALCELLVVLILVRRRLLRVGAAARLQGRISLSRAAGSLVVSSPPAIVELSCESA
jgi:hypothetical protein